MTASVAYVAYIQACWTILAAVMLATVLAMLAGVLFLALLQRLVREWWA